MHICFVLRGYPTKEEPYQPFSRELIGEIAKLGPKCTIIAPQSITRALKHKVKIRPRHWIDHITNSISVDVYQPYCITTSKVTNYFFNEAKIKAAKRAFHRLPEKVDMLYGHFWDMGVLAAQISDNTPVFIGCGEAYIENIPKRVSTSNLEILKRRLKGVIYVSTNAYNEAVRIGLQNDTPYLIAPNGYNPDQFKVLDKNACRKELGWRKDDVVVSFVGSFDERKGVYRLIEAVKNEPDIKMALIGRGQDIRTNDQIIFAGSLPHKDVCRYLCASDIFVLPTRAEGCCNAIVEAIGCGLPIISSDGDFNNDILDESNSIRIDPDNISEIHDSINLLKNDLYVRTKLQQGSIEKSKELSIGERTKRILNFMLNNGSSE